MDGNFIEILVAIPVIWCATTVLVGWLTGWARLARAYPHQPQREGQRFRFQTIHMAHKGGYGSCVAFGATPFGLHLSILALFRPGHPPIFVPWSDVAARRKDGARVVLEFTREPSIPVIMPPSLAAKIAAASRGAFRYPVNP